MVLVQNCPFFQLFLRGAIQVRKMSFTISQNELTPFQAIKIRTKSQKIDVFPKGLTHGFGAKMAIFPTFVLGNIGQENVFYDILERKMPFQAFKTRSSKSRKIDIFKGVNPWFWSKKMLFFPLFFQAIQARKTSFTIFQSEKHLFRL